MTADAPQGPGDGPPETAEPADALDGSADYLVDLSLGELLVALHAEDTAEADIIAISM